MHLRRHLTSNIIISISIVAYIAMIATVPTVTNMTNCKTLICLVSIDILELKDVAITSGFWEPLGLNVFDELPSLVVTVEFLWSMG